MRRLRCKWGKGYLFLGILAAVFCYLFCLRYGVFGSKVDWISQHSVLPDYFRQRFYETGEWFPEFAANIGGGQNIYNFAYYGLYNPVLMLSYLLPFVKMQDYMMAVQFLSFLVSVLLMYHWLGKRGFSRIICMGVSVMFLLAGPMIYHSYSQIMFVNYMPFLLLGLLGADRYFEHRGSCERDGGGYVPDVWLTVSIFLMIMTSFYFSIGGMLVLVLYGIYRFFVFCEKESRKITLSMFLMEGIKFAVPFILAVMMSGVLLAPTAFALTGRKGGHAGSSLLELLIPTLPASRFCYSTHGIGLTTLSLTALTAMLFAKKWQERALAWCCMAALTVPVFAYLLNGGLYIRDKAMIPFLPLLCYVLACYLDSREVRTDSVRKKRRDLVMEILPYVVTVVLIYVCRRQGEAGKYWKLLVADGVLMLVCSIISLFCRVRSVRQAVLMVPGIIMLILFGIGCHAQGVHVVSREFYKSVTDSSIGELITKTLESEEGFYRTEQLGSDVENAADLNRIWDMDQYISSIYSSSYHEGYQEFREETFQLEEPFRNFLMQSAVHNPVYQRFMGVKYVASDKEVPGYEVMESKGGLSIYQNDRVSPVVYATDRVITEEMYRKLEFPYNQLALLRYAVVKDTSADKSVGKSMKEKDITEEIDRVFGIERADVELPELADTESDEKIRIDLPVPHEEESGEKTLFIRFRVENLKPSKDVAIWIEGIRNKLTARNHFYYNDNTEFTYAVPLKENQKSVEVILGTGRYRITDVRAYLGSFPEEDERVEKDDRLYQSEIQIDKEETAGNCIAGTIDVKRRGYLVTTIPYDGQFEILIDDKEAVEEEVNTAFLGCKIEPGIHEIRMVYHARGATVGKIVSAAGVLIFVVFRLIAAVGVKRRKNSGFNR